MTLKHRFAAWRGFVFTGNRELAGKVGLKAARRHVLYNGAIECRLVEFPVLPPKPEEDEAEACLPEVKAPAAGCEVASAVSPGPHSASRSTSLGAGRTPHSVRGDGGETFANRLRKNVKKLRAWLVREGVTCYRAYDRDIPEYALAVDVYEQWAHVQEDERQDSIDPLRAEARLHDAMAAIREVLEIPAERIFIKHRGHNWGPTQHGRAGEDEALVEVKEGGLRFLANLSDYFDCGLFLDHRLTRGIVRDLAAGKRFLNLFAYTGSATVYAAAGGASETTTVDLSQTYLAWAERNMQLNGFSGRRHQFVRADALRFIEQERGRYDLIFLDPPTFSHSKGMQGSFQVQRDQARLLNATFQLLRPGGVLLFSNNFRQFKMEPGTLEGAGIEEISRRTIPLDFARNQRIHRCWKICRKR
jgi:23S rRNA (guanine2445-N2)-methyltransferase / 23S rRNA (guanine2069-N7)-methyltransferase